MKHITLSLLFLAPLFGFGQFNLMDKLDFYADIAPYQIKQDYQNGNKVAFSLTANYNIIRYIGLGIGLNSNAGYESSWTFEDNLRQTSIYFDVRPKFSIGKNQIFCFGNIGLPIAGDYTIEKSGIFGSDPNEEYKADLYYATGIGYARKVFGRLGLQVNYKWANIHVDRFSMPTILKGEGQHILSIGVVF